MNDRLHKKGTSIEKGLEIFSENPRLDNILPFTSREQRIEEKIDRSNEEQEEEDFRVVGDAGGCLFLWVSSRVSLRLVFIGLHQVKWQKRISVYQ